MKGVVTMCQGEEVRVFVVVYVSFCGTLDMICLSFRISVFEMNKMDACVCV